MKTYYVYIMASISRVLYTGVTGDLLKRVEQHRSGEVKGFTSRYNVRKLVHYEAYGNPRDAIAREKQIKGWLREKKVALIESANPKWMDLAQGLCSKGSRIRSQ